ncbi:TIGR04283 family arsenosugar biosynthesis glycosyltransferase [Seonamhaeicola marinus]|uniref:Glycosyltransferase n=1 Tax=Seonamhaeicola marinus TaxID=1912246 RepID=A0A5D0HV80_9FLAO|nr:TIGR04283 family arsenosugar biosynthesis glycosyltransferase [Seonamhaeicola marinus]TYA74821.1 glycosyltransferase [Seonamhaeicola marinus]
MSSISIIIPTLNEEAYIEKLLIHLLKNSSKENIKDIIIVDGGSTDNTEHLVNKVQNAFSQTQNTQTNIKFTSSEKGRAKQMNAGAKNALGSILYFLHADSFPPKNFDKLIINEVKKGNEAGCFKMKFNTNHLWLKLAGWLTQFSWKVSRGGDQSQFITTSLFKSIGGFDERFVIYEDNDLISKLYDRNQFVVIQEWLTTSPRCYAVNGVWKLQYHYWRIHLKKWLGADAKTLNNYYLKHVLVKK